MSQELLTSTEVARLLGVGPTTVKRWTDAGVIRCIKTPGQHRRIPRSEVDRLLLHTDGAAALNRVAEWIGLLTGDGGVHALQSELLMDRTRLGSWWKVGELVGNVIEEIGRGWEQGTISILEEHLASTRLGRALARVSEELPTASGAPRCLLVSALGDEHTLGLSLVELCLRELGMATRWAGARTPIAEIVAVLERREIEIVLVSASSASVHAPPLVEQTRALGEACRRAGAQLILGGRGGWPEAPLDALRYHTLGELHRALLDRSPARAALG
jgi:excisionase family DNA binding protein